MDDELRNYRSLKILYLFKIKIQLLELKKLTHKVAVLQIISMKKLLIGISCFLSLLSCQPKPTPPIKAAVVSARREASEIGLQIIREGGNAFDAMVATSFALTVVYPFAGNITGGGFMVYRLADGTTHSLDYREAAPGEANKELFLDRIGNVLPQKSTLGGLAVGVPGAVAGILDTHEALGTMSLKELILPAIRLAREGFVVTPKQAKTLNRYRHLFIQVNGPDTFYAYPYKAGDTIKNPALARTLETIAENGKKGFYEGWIAQVMVKKTKQTGGILSLQDLKSYQTRWREPIRFSYKDLTISSMAPPSSGGICLGQMFQMIEPYDLGKMGHQSVESIHLMVEVERRSYADRNHFLGDPDFVNIPTQSLLDSSYLQERMRSYDRKHATPSEEIAHGKVSWRESEETTHFSILDSQGNAVAVTTTLNGAYGSKVFVDEIGVFMNNEMDDFSSKPGIPNMFGLTGSEANSIAPRKRMLSSMAPTIVEKNEKLYMVLGTPGGSTIITSVFQTILNVYEHGMNIQEAIDAPRFHHQWLPDQITFEPRAFPPDIIQSLQNMGHKISEQNTRIIGKVNGILVNPNGKIQVGADPRGDDTAATY